MFKYVFCPPSESCMCLSLAHSNINADWLSGNVPTVLVQRLISRFNCAMALFDLIRHQYSLRISI